MYEKKRDLKFNSLARGKKGKGVNKTSSEGGPSLSKEIEISRGTEMEDKVGENVKNIREGRELGRVEGLGNNLEHTEGTVEAGGMILKKAMLGKGM